jgi:hypothetical protein
MKYLKHYFPLFALLLCLHDPSYLVVSVEKSVGARARLEVIDSFDSFLLFWVIKPWGLTSVLFSNLIGHYENENPEEPIKA